MSIPRCVEPEWLDKLPPEDPRAIRSRRDLQRVNRWMQQMGIMQRALTGCCEQRAPRALLELGVGDGTLLLWVVRPAHTRPRPWGA